MRARIYQPAKTAMQSGSAKTHQWVLEFAPASEREVDPRRRRHARKSARGRTEAAQGHYSRARLWREFRHRPQGRLDALSLSVLRRRQDCT